MLNPLRSGPLPGTARHRCPRPERFRGAQFWPALRGRMRSAVTLLVAADCLVLAGYLLALPQAWTASVALWATTVVAYRSAGAYRPRLHLSLLDDAPTLLARNALAIALVGGLVIWRWGATSLDPYAMLAAAGLVGHLVARGTAYRMIRWFRSTGRVGYRTLVLGGGEVSRRVAETIRDHPDYGLAVIGYLDSVPAAQGAAAAGVPGAEGVPGAREPRPDWVRLGGQEDLPHLIERLAVDVVLVGYGRCHDDRTAQILRTSRGSEPTAVFVVPRLFEYGGRWAMQDHVGAYPVLRLDRPRFTGPTWRLKRVMDVAVAGAALVLLTPVLALTALAVRLEGGPGVIFRQERVGRDDRRFQVLKFRSLAPVDPGESDTRWSVAGDDRLGSVGRFIRRTSLDELPQLVNVLRGDMTLVGPRPERPRFVELYSHELSHYPLRHRVPAGITGLAQINGLRGDTSIDERALYDNYYIDHWSLWLDTKIVLGTLWRLARPDGS